VSEIRAASLAEVPTDRPTLVVLDGTRVVLARVGGEVCALGDTCAHQGGPLSEGRLAGPRLACPWHGWMYDVRTGACVLPARGRPVPSYRTRVDGGGDVWVDVE
jgi:nitrite reductase/ring-hydroxylating ferredoxin subunit